MKSQTGQEIELGEDKITKNRSRLKPGLLVKWAKTASIESEVVGSSPGRDAEEIYIYLYTVKDSDSDSDVRGRGRVKFTLFDF